MNRIIPEQTSDRVRKFFGSLCEDQGFRIASTLYSPEAFGNIQVIANTANFCVDYRLDRGDEFLYVVVAGREYLVADAYLLLNGQSFDGAGIETEEKFILENAKRLNMLFSDDRIAMSLKALEAMRLERLHRLYPGAVVKA
jgi:hypothetical protein